MTFKRKPVFFTSDFHVGHANSIVFDKRPFDDVNHMHTVLVNNYNSTVPEDGVCYFLGDMGFDKEGILKGVMDRLNGSTKILVLGNHDSNTYSMYEKGFDVVLNSAVIYIGSNRVSLSHCPLPGIFREDIAGMKGSKDGENWHGEFKNQMFTSYDTTVDYHLHGHIHSGPANKKEKYTERQYDIGAPANKYRPVSISEIESWISLNKKEKSNG